jgi:flagellar basal-body rod protein FlgB
MPLIDNPTADLLKRVATYHNVRQGSIASNIANANTPGYRSFDVVLNDRLSSAARLEPHKTNPRHLALDDQLDRIGADIERSRRPGRLDGNNVSIEDETLKLTHNRLMYSTGMELLERWNSLSRIAREIR